MQGEAHDENAYYSMGGVSGHAGLFSNATDLVAQMAIESFDLIPKGAMPDNAYYDNAKSKIKLLEKRVLDHKAKDYEDLVTELQKKLPEKELLEKNLSEKETS